MKQDVQILIIEMKSITTGYLALNELSKLQTVLILESSVIPLNSFFIIAEVSGGEEIYRKLFYTFSEDVKALTFLKKNQSLLNAFYGLTKRELATGHSTNNFSEALFVVESHTLGGLFEAGEEICRQCGIDAVELRSARQAAGHSFGFFIGKKEDVEKAANMLAKWPEKSVWAVAISEPSAHFRNLF